MSAAPTTYHTIWWQGWHGSSMGTGCLNNGTHKKKAMRQLVRYNTIWPVHLGCPSGLSKESMRCPEIDILTKMRRWQPAVKSCAWCHPVEASSVWGHPVAASCGKLAAARRRAQIQAMRDPDKKTNRPSPKPEDEEEVGTVPRRSQQIRAANG